MSFASFISAKAQSVLSQEDYVRFPGERAAQTAKNGLHDLTKNSEVTIGHVGSCRCPEGNEEEVASVGQVIHQTRQYQNACDSN